MNNFVLKGNIIYTPSFGELKVYENGFLVCEDNLVQGVYNKLPEKFENLGLFDFTDKIIIPGLIDAHLHAPQFAFMGMGMDLQLLEWLETYTFKEERKYSDLEYAEEAYEYFVEELTKSFTTRISAFSTIHKNSTLLLMDKLEKRGFKGFVGKVNMDTNSPSYLSEYTKVSVIDTIDFIEESLSRFNGIKPIITPRFAISCSEELLNELGNIAEKYCLPIQSHLSENVDEIKWVKELFSNIKCYADVYDRFNLFNDKTLMAHCVYPNEEEYKLMRDKKITAVHCPVSNMNIASGISPVRKLIENGINVTLGTDVAGGSTLSMIKVISDSIQNSKLKYLFTDKQDMFLSPTEGLFLATKANERIFGKVGSFEPGYEFDALVIDDSLLGNIKGVKLVNRLERVVSRAVFSHIKAKFISGKRVI